MALYISKQFIPSGHQTPRIPSSFEIVVERYRVCFKNGNYLSFMSLPLLRKVEREKNDLGAAHWNLTCKHLYKSYEEKQEILIVLLNSIKYNGSEAGPIRKTSFSHLAFSL